MLEVSSLSHMFASKIEQQSNQVETLFTDAEARRARARTRLARPPPLPLADSRESHCLYHMVPRREVEPELPPTDEWTASKMAGLRVGK